MNSKATDRRSFLKWTGAAVAAWTWPSQLEAFAGRVSRAARGDDDSLWQTVRDEFLMPPDRLYLNVGTLGPQPRVVVDAVNETTRLVASTYPPSVEWDVLKSRLGGLIGCDPAGLVFPRNTTEGMSFVAAGLEWDAGDEILTTDHEHIGGLSCWQLAAKRYGLTLRQLTMPVPLSDPSDVVELLRRAITARTRVISVSHLTFTNGTLLPIGEIVKLCREHGIISVVDGAHPPGLMRIDIGALDPDFYASSPHKWLLAPQGTGFLYMREEWRTRLWPTLASGGWDDVSLGAQRFNHMGSMDVSRLTGLEVALQFHEAIGTDRIESRARTLRRRLLDRLSEDSRVGLRSPQDDDLGVGMVAFTVDGIESLDLQSRLARAARVRTRVIGEYDLGWMRLSPHVYNTEDEMDRVVDLIQAER